MGRSVSHFCMGAAILGTAISHNCRQTQAKPSLVHRIGSSVLWWGSMNEIKIEVWDATGNKRQLVEVPSDAEVNRLLAVLIERLNLPRHSPDGQMMSYKFHHKRSGRQLLDTDTLASAEVQEGDVLRLQPEITAGMR